MINKGRIVNLFQSPSVLSFVLFLIFYAVTGYKYGWDDQHLEIPLLKHLINPQLFSGDYYVESLKQNFTSFFYPLLARVISVEQIPAAYYFLFVLSRYFLFYFSYRLWLFLSKDRFKAFACVFTFILIIRVEEFLYRTFSHQEFALAIIAAGIYFFFKERFFIASLLFGLGANFHALYCLFPMSFLLVYLLFSVKRHGWKTLITSGIVFGTSALPVLWWIISKRLGAGPANELLQNTDWLSLYITSCPQNFFYPQAPTIPWQKLVTDSKIFLLLNRNYIFLFTLLLLNLSVNDSFRKNKKAVVFSLTAFAFVIVSFIFTYLYPNRFVLDLNLIRNTQFMIYVLGGFTTLFIINTMEERGALTAFCLSALFTFLKFDALTGSVSLILMGLLTSLHKSDESKMRARQLIKTFLLLLTGLGVCAIVFFLTQIQFRFSLLLSLTMTIALLSVNFFIRFPLKIDPRKRWYLRTFLIIPMLIFLTQYLFHHQEKSRVESEGEGFWRLQRSWEDMQRYVKESTPKDAMVLVPYNMEMGGFRILSERKIVCSYRDCGIIGFDYGAAVEWSTRVKDIYNFQFQMTGSLNEAIKNAIVKYHADYIVFRRYAAPPDNPVLRRVYTNMDFALFEVVRPR